MKYLIDTNMISELVRVRPNHGVKNWAATVQRIYVSVITLEELHYGLAWKPNHRIDTWLNDFLEASCEILPVSAKTVRVAGMLRGKSRSNGRTQSQADMLIAASALEHGLIFVTANTKDFESTGVSLLNPFEK